MSIKYVALIVLLVVLSLWNKPDNGVNSVTATTSLYQAHTENIAKIDDALSIGPRLQANEFNGRLLIVQDDTLIALTFDGSEQQVLTRNIISEPVLSSDQQEIAVIARDDNGDEVILQFDVMTLENTNSTVISRRGRILSWSPDKTWIVIEETNGRAILVNLTDGEIRDSVLGVDKNTMAWLMDGRFIFLVGDPLTGLMSPIFLYDPESNFGEPLFDIDTQAGSGLFQSIVLFENELAALDFELSQSVNYIEPIDAFDDGTLLFVSFPEAHVQGDLCSIWYIDRYLPTSGEQQLVLNMDNTQALDAVQALNDGSFLFLRWFKPNCDVNQPLTAELIRVLPDGTQEILTNTITYPATLIDPYEVNQSVYTISPNQRYVAWIETSETNFNSVSIWDLASATVIEVLDFSDGAKGNLQSIQWIP